jgi:class 3 adenylate cyclase
MTEEIEDPAGLLGRMDLITEKVEDKGKKSEEGEEFSVFGLQMKPNPDRYERIDDDAQKGWLDTMDDVFIPDDVLKEAWEQTDGLPIYYSPPEIDDFAEYIEIRKQYLKSALDSGDISYSFSNESTQVLQDLQARDEPIFVIMIVDIVGSTKMNANLAPSAYAALVHTFIQETRLLVNKHRGFVLKYTGDGLIAYFPEPNVVGQHDNAILCADRLSTLVSEALNPVYGEFGLPRIQWRVGLDTGSPGIFPGAQGTRDLLGTSVSMAAKIESAANTDEILIGEYTEKNLHTDWRKRTEEVTKDRDWGYTRGDEIYSIYKLT